MNGSLLHDEGERLSGPGFVLIFMVKFTLAGCINARSVRAEFPHKTHALSVLAVKCNVYQE